MEQTSYKVWLKNFLQNFANKAKIIHATNTHAELAQKLDIKTDFIYELTRKCRIHNWNEAMIEDGFQKIVLPLLDKDTVALDITNMMARYSKDELLKKLNLSPEQLDELLTIPISGNLYCRLKYLQKTGQQKVEVPLKLKRQQTKIVKTKSKSASPTGPPQEKVQEAPQTCQKTISHVDLGGLQIQVPGNVLDYLAHKIAEQLEQKNFKPQVSRNGKPVHVNELSYAELKSLIPDYSSLELRKGNVSDETLHLATVLFDFLLSLMKDFAFIEDKEVRDKIAQVVFKNRIHLFTHFAKMSRYSNIQDALSILESNLPKLNKLFEKEEN